MLYSFTRGSDGGNPIAGLIADSSGNLYGTTEYGGVSENGVVFKLTPGGTYTVLYSFTGGSDGSGPVAGLIADSAGNLYGTTEHGGVSGNGVVFKLSPGGSELPGGSETVLYSFTGGSDGSGPVAGLIADSAGNLYGTTEHGGVSGNGVVFKLSPGGSEFAGRERDGALLLYGRQRRERAHRRPDCRQQRQSLWHDSEWRRTGKQRHGVQAGGHGLRPAAPTAPAAPAVYLQPVLRQ